MRGRLSVIRSDSAADCKSQPSLSGHLNPANDGHLESSQRDRLVPTKEGDVEKVLAIPASESSSSFPKP